MSNEDFEQKEIISDSVKTASVVPENAFSVISSKFPERQKNLLCNLFRSKAPDLDHGIYRLINLRRSAVENFLEKDLSQILTHALTAYDGSGHNPPLTQCANGTVSKIEDAVIKDVYGFFSLFFRDGDIIPRRRTIRTWSANIDSSNHDEEVTMSWNNSDRYYVKSESSRQVVERNSDSKIFSQEQLVQDYFIHKDLTRFLESGLDHYIGELPEWLDKSPDSEIRSTIVRDVCKGIIKELGRIEESYKTVWEKPRLILSTNYVVSFLSLKKLVTTEAYEKIFRESIEVLQQKNEFRTEVEQVVSELYKIPSRNIFVKDLRFGRDSIQLSYKRRFSEGSKFKAHLNSRGRAAIWSLKVRELFRGRLQDVWYVEENAPNLKKSVSYESLYTDTRFLRPEIKELLLEELSRGGQFDQLLDGTLIKGDNWHALNLIIRRFRGSVKCLYVDPPYNTGVEELPFDDKFHRSAWLSMMYDRMALASKLLDPRGSVYVSIDSNESHDLKQLLDQILGRNNFQREIIWNTGDNISGFKSTAPNWIRQHDTIYFYSADSHRTFFNKLWKPLRPTPEANWSDIIGEKKGDLYFERWSDGILGRHGFTGGGVKPIGDVWNDIYSFQFSEPRVTESWFFTTQKVENLLRRIIQSATTPEDLVLDCFLGSGTTAAVAQKLGRKWIGIEFGNYFESKILLRLKGVIVGDARTHLTRDIGWCGGGFFKYQYIESFEDAITAQIETREFALEGAKAETAARHAFFKATENSAEEFCWRPVLSEEGGDNNDRASRVDPIETFNYLIGLKISEWKFARENKRKYVFLNGEAGGQRVLAVWRDTNELDPEADEKVISREAKKFKAEVIYANDQNHFFLQGLKLPLAQPF